MRARGGGKGGLDNAFSEALTSTLTSFTADGFKNNLIESMDTRDHSPAAASITHRKGGLAEGEHHGDTLINLQRERGGEGGGEKKRERDRGDRNGGLTEKGRRAEEERRKEEQVEGKGGNERKAVRERENIKVRERIKENVKTPGADGIALDMTHQSKGHKVQDCKRALGRG